MRVIDVALVRQARLLARFFSVRLWKCCGVLVGILFVDRVLWAFWWLESGYRRPREGPIPDKIGLFFLVLFFLFLVLRNG